MSSKVPRKKSTSRGASPSAYVFEDQVKHLVNNILKNVTYVTDACKCKTVNEAHLKAVSLIQANIKHQKIAYIPASEKKKLSKTAQSGGNGTVMAPSFFGVDESAIYKDIATIQGNEVHVTADSAFARAEHPIKMPMGGGSTEEQKEAKKLKSLVKKYVKDYVSKNKGGFTRVTKQAVEIIEASVQKNIGDLKEATLKKYGALTGGNIKSTIGSVSDFLYFKI